MQGEGVLFQLLFYLCQGRERGTGRGGTIPDLETLCFKFGSIFGKGNEEIEWEALPELVVALLVAMIRTLGSQRDKRRKALSLLVGINSIFITAAWAVLLSKFFCLLGHTIFSWFVPVFPGMLRLVYLNLTVHLNLTFEFNSTFLRQNNTSQADLLL